MGWGTGTAGTTSTPYTSCTTGIIGATCTPYTTFIAEAVDGMVAATNETDRLVE